MSSISGVMMMGLIAPGKQTSDNGGLKFNDILLDVADEGSTGSSGGYDAQKAQLDQYLSKRDAEAEAKYGDNPPSAIAVAMPNIPGFGTPFITAEQQSIIDGITAKYSDFKDADKMMSELAANGVHPDQLVQTADYFVGAGGKVTAVNHTATFSSLINIFA